jgi:hypothetical protein
MKTVKFFAATILVAVAMIFVSCSKDEVDTPFYTADNGVSKELSTLEKEGLLNVLETTKMHRDIYEWINSQFPSEVFADMARRDGQAMELLSIKVDKYGLVNPIEGKLPGEFTDANIQEEYNEFVRTTVGDLGAMINQARAMEEDFIASVEEQEASLSGNADIKIIYQDLVDSAVVQLNALDDSKEGLIHIYAPRNEIREM